MKPLTLPQALNVAEQWCMCNDQHPDRELFAAVAALVVHTRRLRTTDLIDLSVSAQQQTAELLNRIKAKP